MQATDPNPKLTVREGTKSSNTNSKAVGEEAENPTNTNLTLSVRKGQEAEHHKPCAVSERGRSQP